MANKKTSERLALSIGAKVRQEQYDAVVARAAQLGIDKSEFVRQCILSNLNSVDVTQQLQNCVAELMRPVLAEVLELRNIYLNSTSFQVSGQPLTIEHLDAVRAHADANKAARARALLAAVQHPDSSDPVSSPDSQEVA